MAENVVPSRGELVFGKRPDGSYAVMAIDANGKILASSPQVLPAGYISAGAANQDSTVAKAVPATLWGLALQNTHATLMRYVKIYDKASGPTSSDTPVLRFALAPAGGGITRQQISEQFANGISFRITSGPLDNDTGAASAGDVFVNLDCS